MSLASDLFKWCSTDEEVDRNSKCIIRKNSSCDNEAVMEFIFPPQVNTSSYQIVFDNSHLHCFKTNLSIRNTLDSGDLLIKALNITFNSSIIWFKDISIDTGVVTSDNGSGSVTLTNKSVLKTDITSSTNTRESQRLYFTGNCFLEDEYTDTSLNNIWNNTYGQVTIPADYSPLTASKDELRNRSFFGAGSNSSNLTLGGGRIFLRTDMLVIPDEGSFISSSAFDAATDTNKYYGTGGTIILALGNFQFIDRDHFPLLKVRGANSNRSISGRLLGGGGRIYAEVRNQVNMSRLVNFLDAGWYEDPTFDQRFYGQTGTVYLQNSENATIYFTSRLTTKYSGYNCYTILNSSNIWPKPSLNLRIEASGTGKLIYINNYNENKSASFDLPDIEVTNNSTLYLISSTFSFSDDTIVSPSPMITFNCRSVQVSQTGSLIPINNIFFNITDKFVLTNKGYLQFPPINYPNPNYPNFFLTINSPTILIDQSSTISFVDSSTKRNTSSSLVLSPTSNFTCKDSTIASDRTFIMLSLLNDAEQVFKNTNFKSFENYCPTNFSDPNIGPEFLLNSLSGHFSRKKQTVDERRQYLQQVTDSFTGSKLSDSKSVLVIFGNNVSLQQTVVSEVGFVGISVTGNLKIDKQTNITVNAFGCAPSVLPIQSTSSKYLKICKVIGGNNVGRGTLGAQKNFENCKYVLSSSKNTIPIESIFPGLGGQKNHQMESDKSGFGGGVISIWASKLTTDGYFNADGGAFSERDYTMIAGGSGGTVAFIADSMDLGGVVSCRGGLGSAEVRLI